MRFRTVFLTIACCFHTWAAYAQPTISPADQFRSGNPEERRQVLFEIVVHESTASDSERLDIIALALSDPTLREAALAAVVSRAAAPVMGPVPKGVEKFAKEWVQDRLNLQVLRPAIEGALHDSDERVRSRAIAALASLDFDENSWSVRLSPRTQKLFVDLYYSESSSKVRQRIVTGFAAESTIPSLDVRQLLTRAFADPDPAVHQAVTMAAEKLPTDVGMPLLVAQLADENRDVRLQAVVTLTKMGPRASAHVENLKDRLVSEVDPQIRQMLVTAVKVLSGDN